MLYGDWIGRWGRSFPDTPKPCGYHANRRYTYGEFAKDDVHRMAIFLGFFRDQERGSGWLSSPSTGRSI